MDTRLAELSRTIEPAELGRRIRNARVAAGMTQGQLAGDDVTAAYVSRIEDGQRRPEFGLLRRMTERMGTTISELLEEPSSPQRLQHMLALDHAELNLRAGNSQEALRAALHLTDELNEGGGDDLRRRCAVLLAGALEATGDLNGAILELERLCAVPERSPEWLRSLIALSRCYRESGDLDRAIQTGENAQALIEELGLTGLTESIQLTVTVAFAYLYRGDRDRAMRICRQAIDQAEQIDSPVAKASAYWNASILESQNGANESALELARIALSYFEVSDDTRNLARLRGHVADMQLELDPPDPQGALAAIAQAERELKWSAGSTVDRASQEQTRARAFLLLGDVPQARAAVAQALELAPESAAVSRAFAHALLGQIDMEVGDVDAARTAFLAAVRLLSGIGADREAAQLWFELGGLLNDVGESAAALDAYKRAAASTGLRAPSRASKVTPG